jgi:hypothetical protein
MMNKSDINWALHEIEQMVIIARRSTQNLKPSKDPAYHLLPVGEHESLTFSLGDILDKVTALKDDWDTEQPATTAPDAGSDGEEPSAITSKAKAYFDMDGFLCNVVYMIQLADDMALDFEVPEDREGWDRLSFAIHHSRLMVEAFRRCYDQMDFGSEATVVGVT